LHPEQGSEDYAGSRLRITTGISTRHYDLGSPRFYIAAQRRRPPPIGRAAGIERVGGRDALVAARELVDGRVPVDGRSPGADGLVDGTSDGRVDTCPPSPPGRSPGRSPGGLTTIVSPSYQ
jgi:hypothetical protein